METPSLRLANRIIERLVQAKLLTQEDSQKLLPRIADGKMRPEDWRLPIETATETEPKI
jgi:hypothetical protein